MLTCETKDVYLTSELFRSGARMVVFFLRSLSSRSVAMWDKQGCFDMVIIITRSAYLTFSFFCHIPVQFMGDKSDLNWFSDLKLR